MAIAFPPSQKLLLIVWLGFLLLSADWARAQGLLLSSAGTGGANITISTESFQARKYSATIAQQFDFSCGSAAVATLLTYNYGIQANEKDVFKSMYENGDKDVIAKTGFSLLDIKNYVGRLGLKSNGYKAPLEKLAAVKVPAIVLITVRGYNHFVVLDGIRDGWVLLSDPANGLRSEPVGEFERQWSGVFFLILTDAEKAQGRFNEPDRWAVAPLPPWALTQYAVSLGTLPQTILLSLGRF